MHQPRDLLIVNTSKRFRPNDVSDSDLRAPTKLSKKELDMHVVAKGITYGIPYSESPNWGLPKTSADGVWAQ